MKCRNSKTDPYVIEVEVPDQPVVVPEGAEFEHGHGLKTNEFADEVMSIWMGLEAKYGGEVASYIMSYGSSCIAHSHLPFYGYRGVQEQLQFFEATHDGLPAGDQFIALFRRFLRILEENGQGEPNLKAYPQ